MREAITRKIVQMGASCGVTLPVASCRAFGIERGDLVEFVATKRGLLLKTIAKAAPMSLKERLRRTDPAVIRASGRALDAAPSVGREWP